MKQFLKLLIACISSFLLSHCDNATLTQTKLERIKQSGTLHVLTRIDPTTYYQGVNGYAGLEFDLINLFAKQLGVKVKIETPATFEKILKKISKGKADIAAAGLTITPDRQKTMRFAPAYHEITEQLIYRSNTRRPADIDSLEQGILEVTQGTSHIETLKRLQKEHQHLTWETNPSLDTSGLLYLVNEGLIDYTITDSNQALLLRQFYPKLNIAFDVSDTRQLAWALARDGDDSLYNEVVAFFQRIKADNTLAQLIEKHYGHVSRLSYVDNCQFRQHQKTRLPKYQRYFDQAATTYNLDWRLLAAIGYQESHWLADAVSPYGVEGLMMLTNDTADLLNIKDRTDPIQSIEGGARYFQRRHELISNEIPEPDRTWFALASYNVGIGHLEDARQLTKQQDGNPNKWLDVKQRLPLLTEEKWHQQTKYGYARGKEPVHYVENIRSYYDLLVWLTEENQIQKYALTPKTNELDTEPYLIK